MMVRHSYLMDFALNVLREIVRRPPTFDVDRSRRSHQSPFLAGDSA